jgi:hypothetical protein
MKLSTPKQEARLWAFASSKTGFRQIHGISSAMGNVRRRAPLVKQESAGICRYLPRGFNLKVLTNAAWAREAQALACCAVAGFCWRRLRAARMCAIMGSQGRGISAACPEASSSRSTAPRARRPRCQASGSGCCLRIPPSSRQENPRGVRTRGA